MGDARTVLRTLGHGPQLHFFDPTHWLDTQQTGLLLRVKPDGARSSFYEYRPSGPVPLMTRAATELLTITDL